jgi:DNA-binding CsgD family transcriptional regulator
MADTQTGATFDTYTALKVAVSLLSDSANAQDLCRRVTHSEIFGGLCRGVAIFLLDNKSAFFQVSGYGDVTDESAAQIYSWDEHFLASCVRSRAMTFEHGPTGVQSCLPIEMAGVVIGGIMFAFSAEYTPLNPNREITKLLANLAGLFMDTKGASFTNGASSSPAFTESKDVSGKELTTRQHRILRYVADGLTNAEISKQVMLSKSTVRQETIRIFRSLQCHTRSEAIVKARAMGLIEPVTAVFEIKTP